jgi:opacity protein-like surface antigen
VPERPHVKKETDTSYLPPIAIVALALLLPAAALAGDDDGFDRRGFYVGIGGAYGVDFFESTIEDVAEDAGFKVSVDDTGGVNARAGYRLASWFAIEGMYEWMDNFKIEVDEIIGLDPELQNLLDARIDYTTHTVTVNAKLLLPTWRFQPYLLLGIGAQYYDLDASARFAGLGFDFDESGWGVAGRPGLGLDAYITENILINVELAGVLATSNPSTIPDIGDLFYLTVGGGLQYRF